MKHIALLAVALVAPFFVVSCVDEDFDGWNRPSYGYDGYGYDGYDGYGYGRRERELDRREWELERRERRLDRREPPPPRRHASAPTRGFSRVGSFRAGGAQEVSLPGRGIHTVRIVAASGSVALNTVVIRRGGAKTPQTVSGRLEEGQWYDVSVGGGAPATGLRVSTGGGGTYEVWVR